MVEEDFRVGDHQVSVPDVGNAQKRPETLMADEELGIDSEDRSRVARTSSIVTTMLSTLCVCLLTIQNMMPMVEGSESLCMDDEDRHVQQRAIAIAQQQKLAFFCTLMRDQLASSIPRVIECGWYIKPRSMQWFMFFIEWTPREDPLRFKHFFRINPAMFYHIVDLLQDELQSHAPISLTVLPNQLLIPERQVALAIRRLATGDSFLGLAKLFGLSKTTTIRSYWRVVDALLAKAQPIYLFWPEGDRMQEVKQKFWTEWGFPNCCGAIDGTHIPIELPDGEDPKDYFDYKHNKSISVQAIVDSDLRFLDVFAGWPGSVQDTRLLRKSNFYMNVVYHESRLNGPAFRIRFGAHVREYLLADGCYPCWDWLIVPFPKGINPLKDEWNELHSSTRMCVERAFGRLKGTWRVLARILWKPMILRIKDAVLACAILHNMIIDRREVLNPAIYNEYDVHPRGYNIVIHPTRAFFDGGREARETCLEKFL